MAGGETLNPLLDLFPEHETEMAPFTLMLIGIILYILNQRADVHFGLRGLPWLDAPSLFVLTGGILFVGQKELARHRKRKKEEREAAYAARYEALTGPARPPEEPR